MLLTGRQGLKMRAFGLLLLLCGSVVLALPMINALFNRSFRVEHGAVIGGILLCIGVAAIALSRPRDA
ncbi:MAG: hypothetical protein EOP20_15110 [Hyphomicrobiales bacterium]|nr:MAG: hypothetical protein EOP20_15110 [Hyphomicrobiales bacterium]